MAEYNVIISLIVSVSEPLLDDEVNLFSDVVRRGLGRVNVFCGLSARYSSNIVCIKEYNRRVSVLKAYIVKWREGLSQLGTVLVVNNTLFLIEICSSANLAGRVGEIWLRIPYMICIYVLYVSFDELRSTCN